MLYLCGPLFILLGIVELLECVDSCFSSNLEEVLGYFFFKYLFYLFLTLFMRFPITHISIFDVVL